MSHLLLGPVMSTKDRGDEITVEAPSEAVAAALLYVADAALVVHTIEEYRVVPRPAHLVLAVMP